MTWISVKDKLPTHHAIVRIRKNNGDEAKAYFYMDKIQWIDFYGKKTSYFWDYDTKLPIDGDITHWEDKRE
jgi:endonuclease I